MTVEVATTESTCWEPEDGRWAVLARRGTCSPVRERRPGRRGALVGRGVSVVHLREGKGRCIFIMPIAL